MDRGYQIFPRGKKYINNFDDIFKPKEKEDAEKDASSECSP